MDTPPLVLSLGIAVVTSETSVEHCEPGVLLAPCQRSLALLRLICLIMLSGHISMNTYLVTLHTLLSSNILLCSHIYEAVPRILHHHPLVNRPPLFAHNLGGLLRVALLCGLYVYLCNQLSTPLSSSVAGLLNIALSGTPIANYTPPSLKIILYYKINI